MKDKELREITYESFEELNNKISYLYNTFERCELLLHCIATKLDLPPEEYTKLRQKDNPFHLLPSQFREKWKNLRRCKCDY